MKKVLCITLLVFLLFSSIGFSQEIPTLHKYVNDLANVLSSADEARINSLCAEIENNWTIEIAILTVNTTQSMSIEQYAVETFQENGIGKKDTNNGLLIVAAIQDKKWRFEVGYGLEPIINDAKAGRIGRAYLTPYFQNESYGDGLYYAVDAINKVIQNAGDDSFISDQGFSTDETFFVIIMLFTLFFLLLPLILILIFKFGSQKCPRCGTRMNCHYEGNYVGDNYLVCKCPKCGKKTKKKKRRNFFFFVGGVGGGGFGGGGGGGGGFGGGGSGGGGASGGF